jgi:acetyltransferase
VSGTGERLRPLFHPRGIVVTGVSSHPGKFGTVAYHNLLRFGYAGEVFPINREGAEVLGRPTLADVSLVPNGAADLAVICTPARVNADLLRACAGVGVRAAFVASGGYGEVDAEGAELERELVAVADELGMVIVGPNGQGLVSTSVSMCAQIVAPYPPPGSISLVSQSGNLASSLMNYGCLTGVGFSKGVSCGNSAQLEVSDYLEYFGDDPDTAVSISYLEGIEDGRRFLDVARRHAPRTSDDQIFQGVCRQAGISRAQTVEEAYEVAATFATQPLPRGRRTLLLTAAGGWGVLTADACVAAGLELVSLPDDLHAEIDKRAPARWSRGNPVDLAGGERRDTVPEVLELAAAHPDIDAIVYLGIGIQAAQGEVFRSGRFHPDYGLDRMAEFHARQDRRYALAATEASRRHQKPVLVATDLVYTDRTYGNAGPLGVAESGRIAYPSGHRAVSALAHLARYAEYRRRLEVPGS